MLRDETIRRVIQFRDDREWRQFHTPKDLAISLSLEAAELLEQKGIHAGVVKLNRVSPLGPGQAGPHPGRAGGRAELLRPDGRCVRPGSG